MKWWIRYAMVCVCICWGTTAVAASATLPMLLEELLSNNPELKQLTAEIAAARARIPQASSLDDPRLSLAASNIPTGNPSFSRTPMSGWQLYLRQKIPFPGKLRTQKRIAQAQHTQTEYAQLERLNHLVAKFKQAYYEYAYVTHALRITDQTTARLRALIATLEAKYAANQIPQQDVLKTKVELSKIRQQRIQYAEQQAQLVARLTSLLARPAGSALQVVLPRQRLSQLTVDTATLRTLATTHRPWLAKSSARIREATQEHRLAKKSLLPDFDFSAGYRIRSNQLAEPMGGENFFSAGVQINIPLWGWKKQGKHIAETRYALSAAKEEHTALTHEVEYQVASTLTAIEQARAQYHLLTSRIVPEVRAALAASRTSYEAGEVEYLNVISNELSLFANALQRVRYLYDHEQHIAQLEMAVGQRLSDLPKEDQ